MILDDICIQFPFASSEDAISKVLQYYYEGEKFSIPIQMTLCFSSVKDEHDFVLKMAQTLFNEKHVRCGVIVSSGNMGLVPEINNKYGSFFRQFTITKSNTVEWWMANIWQMSPIPFMFLRCPETMYDVLYASSYSAIYPLFLVTTLIDIKHANRGMFLYPHRTK